MTAFPQSISVIIPVHNRAQLIGPCVEHLRASAQRVIARGVGVELVVVDDASRDGSPDVVQKLAHATHHHPHPIPIRLVQLSHRHGPGRARNAALAEATGELVVFIDSDVIATEGLLEAHWRIHHEAQVNGQRAYGVGTLVSVPSLGEALQFPAPTLWDASRASLDTANSSVPRKVLDELGGFDSGFTVYGWEDLDLGRRLKKHGLTRLAVTDAVAYHIQPPIETQEQLLSRLEKERERGMTAVHFMKKHPEWSARLTAQDTMLHRVLNWVFRFGGLVHAGNVLAWVAWARRRGFIGLERMWLSGVLNKAYMDSLAATKRAAFGKVGTRRP